MTQQRNMTTIVAGFAAFIGIGLSAGLLGLAWSLLRVEFEQPLEAVGVLLAAGVGGNVAASFFSGSLIGRFGVARMLVAGAGCLAVGLLLVAFTPVYALIIVGLVIAGMGSGIIDGGLNSYFAEHHGARAMNWLHASFGIGTTISPLILTLAISLELSWRVGYLTVGLVSVGLAAIFLLTRRAWKLVAAQTGDADQPSAPRVSIGQTLRQPAVWVGIMLFLLYAGLEATPGQWVFPLFTDSRGIDAEQAGLWVSVYWGSFTVGRIFFGAVITRLETVMLMRACLIGATLGAVLLWWNPIAWIGFIGLVLLGFAQAPMFPIFISETPKRVGAKFAPNAIGFQVAGAGVGIALMPALAGLLSSAFATTTVLTENETLQTVTQPALELIPPFLVVMGVLTIGLNELAMAQANRAQARRATPAFAAEK